MLPRFDTSVCLLYVDTGRVRCLTETPRRRHVVRCRFSPGVRYCYRGIHRALNLDIRLVCSDEQGIPGCHHEVIRRLGFPDCAVQVDADPTGTVGSSEENGRGGICLRRETTCTRDDLRQFFGSCRDGVRAWIPHFAVNPY